MLPSGSVPFGKVPIRPIAETAWHMLSAAGKLTGFRLSFPLAANTTTPALCAAVSASAVKVSGSPPPKLMLSKSQLSETAASIAFAIA